MTATAGSPAESRSAPSAIPVATSLVAHPRAAAAVVVGGCVLLEGRGLLVAMLPDPALVLVAVFAGLAAVSVAWPIADDPGAGRGWARSAGVAAIGLAAFGLGRLLGGGHAPTSATLTMVAANSLAAVAEEAFFRRLCFALLLPAGAVWAVVGSALLFAAVHLTTYGAWVLPLDLAAGLVFGWQRLVSRSWRVPALTHVIVNLLVVL
jgi:membrane protease YdiL (CAAX protease family)